VRWCVELGTEEGKQIREGNKRDSFALFGGGENKVRQGGGVTGEEAKKSNGRKREEFVPSTRVKKFSQCRPN
jgi:hypothetical protein